MRKHLRLAALAAAICLLCAGCTNRSTAGLTQNSVDLPQPAASEKQVILGEAADEEVLDCVLYYASADGSGLASVQRQISVRRGESAAAQIVAELSHPGMEGLLSPLPGETRLLSLERTGGLVCVDLSLDAAAAQDEARLTMAAAIANSLLDSGAATAVQILVGGCQLEVCSLPVGVFTQPVGSAAAAYAQAQSEAARLKSGSGVSRKLAVYLPDATGEWLLPSVADITFTSAYPAAALAELIANSLVPEGGVILGDPFARVTERGLRVLEVNLSASLLDADGRLPWSAAGSVVMTALSFLPETDAVRLSVEGVPMDGLASVPSSGPDFARKDFSCRVAGTCNLYFSDGSDSLALRTRAVSQAVQQSPLAILRALLDGPLDCESGAVPPFPEGVSSADLRGLSLEDGIASVSLSANFYRRCQNLSYQAERTAVYAIVNTLCDISGIRGVKLFIEGISPQVLSRKIYLRSVLLPNPGLVSG